MRKKLNGFHKKITKLKNVSPRLKRNEDLKENILDNVRDLFNNLHYTYKEIYEEEKYALNKKHKKKFSHTKLRLVDDYLYDSEEGDKQIDKQIDNHLKNQY